MTLHCTARFCRTARCGCAVSRSAGRACYGRGAHLISSHLTSSYVISFPAHLTSSCFIIVLRHLFFFSSHLALTHFLLFDHFSCASSCSPQLIQEQLTFQTQPSLLSNTNYSSSHHTMNYYYKTVSGSFIEGNSLRLHTHMTAFDLMFIIIFIGIARVYIVDLPSPFHCSN